MSNHLTFSTDKIDVCINNYEVYTFNYKGWNISDNYIHNEKDPTRSHYEIILTSHNIVDEEDLYHSRNIGQGIIELITHLIPICGLPSLKAPKYKDFSDDISIFDFKSSPQGWRSNYYDILQQIKTDGGTKLFVNIDFLGICRCSITEKSPLKEICYLIEKFASVNEEVKYLIFLLNSILNSSDINMFMLIGKALEIIDAMYPYKRNHGKKDKRIEVYFPELSDIFHSISIKDLIKLSNNRKEIRHYIKNKDMIMSHESLSKEGRISFFNCSTSLILNVIRDKYGLPHINCYK